MSNSDPKDSLNIYITTQTIAKRSPEQYNISRPYEPKLDFTEHSYGWGAIWSDQPFGE